MIRKTLIFALSLFLLYRVGERSYQFGLCMNLLDPAVVQGCSDVFERVKQADNSDNYVTGGGTSTITINPDHFVSTGTDFYLTFSENVVVDYTCPEGSLCTYPTSK